MNGEGRPLRPPAGEVTGLLEAWRGGDPAALERLLPLVYDELRRVAAQRLRRERPGHTLQPTALVHEAFLRLVGQRVEWEGRSHFFAVASQAMRRVLVDHARARRARKRGGAMPPLDLTGMREPAVDPPSVDVLALDEALTRLGLLEERQARIVELRFFGGLTLEETAAVLGRSVPGVWRDWRSAKAWLFRELSSGA